MDGGADGLRHDDIWDDSALVESWNEALAEYKKYHSIHATGASLDALSEPQNSHAKHETDDRPGAPPSAPPAVQVERNPSPSHHHESNTGTAGGTAVSASQARIDGDDDRPANQHARPEGKGESENQKQSQGMNTSSSGVAASVMPPPQALLGSVRDDDLKRLLMSWYYAGYYTGLYEGQQKHQQQGQ